MNIWNRIGAACLAIWIGSSATAAAQGIPDDWRKPAWEMVAFFETSGANFSAVTKDFDCQGISVGILQWNVGKKSFQTAILAHVKKDVALKAMPTYGEAFWSAYEADIKSAAEGKTAEALLKHVRSFQTYADESSCAARKRKAAWTADGNAFRAEIAAFLTTDEVRKLQEAAVNAKLRAGWNLANTWSKSKYGVAGLQSFEEFAFFVDSVNFNGTWWTDYANFAKVCALRATMSDEALFDEILEYLGSDLPNQVQINEAAQNIELWSKRTPTSDELDLMTLAYLISKHIGAKNAIQFKKNVISRRGAIVFNDGWVNGERKTFPRPAGAPPAREGKCPT